MKNEKFTILIQGPLHPNCLIAIRSYVKDFPVVLSTWSDLNRQEDKIRSMISDNDHVSVVSYNIDSYKKNAYDDASRYKQFLTTYRGLKLVETEYVIKVRSDEYYTDFSDIMEKVLKDPNKMVSNNVFFRKISHSLYHPSDHVYAGKTDTLINVLKECVADCENGSVASINEKCTEAAKNNSTSPEQHLGMNWILNQEKKKNLNDPEIDHEKLMKKYFDVVDLDNMGFYCVSFHGKFSFSPNNFFEEPNDIKTMNDLCPTK